MKATAGLDCLWRTVLAGRVCKKLQMTGLPGLQQRLRLQQPHQDHHGFHLFHLQHQERRQKSNEYKLGLAFLFFASCKRMVLYSPQIQPKCNFDHIIPCKALEVFMCIFCSDVVECSICTIDISRTLFGGPFWVPKRKKVSVFFLSKLSGNVGLKKAKQVSQKLCKFKSKLNEKLTMNNLMCCQIMCWVYAKGCGWLEQKVSARKNMWSAGTSIYIATKHEHGLD